LLAADGLVAGLILCSNQRDTPLGIELNYGLVADNAAQLVTIARQENVFFVQASDEQEIRFALRSVDDWRLQPLCLKDLKQQNIFGLYCSSIKSCRKIIFSILSFIIFRKWPY